MSKEIKTSPDSASKKTNFTPFLVVAFVWAALGGALAVVFSSAETFESLYWFFVFFSACMLNLFFLSKAVNGFIQYMREKHMVYAFQLIFWSALKLTSLVLITILLMKTVDAPRSALFAGFATLFLIPACGGYWWAVRDLNLRSQSYAS